VVCRSIVCITFTNVLLQKRFVLSAVKSFFVSVSPADTILMIQKIDHFSYIYVCIFKNKLYLTLKTLNGCNHIYMSISTVGVKFFFPNNYKPYVKLIQTMDPQYWHSLFPIYRPYVEHDSTFFNYCFIGNTHLNFLTCFLICNNKPIIDNGIVRKASCLKSSSQCHLLSCILQSLGERYLIFPK
jgi:hypothetical protein